MTTKSSTIANLHTPDELLENAEAMLALKNPKMLRGAILEAITALEAYVQETIFANLENKLDPLLVKWLEEKTKMDFDTRLSILTPIATGVSINKQTDLWQAYKAAKEIRNKVTHSGKKVSEAEARHVVDTVYSWLSYLGKTAGLELELFKFKKYIESNNIQVGSMEKSVELISDYFGRSMAAQAATNIIIGVGARRFEADVVLKFGEELAVVETKRLQEFNPEIVEHAKKQVQSLAFDYLSANPRSKGVYKRIHSVVIVFVDEKIPEGYDAVRNFGDQLHIAVVKVKNAHR